MLKKLADMKVTNTLDQMALTFITLYTMLMAMTKPLINLKIQVQQNASVKV